MRRSFRAGSEIALEGSLQALVFHDSGNAQFVGRFERSAAATADYRAAVAAGKGIGNFGGAFRAVK